MSARKRKSRSAIAAVVIDSNYYYRIIIILRVLIKRAYRFGKRAWQWVRVLWMRNVIDAPSNTISLGLGSSSLQLTRDAKTSRAHILCEVLSSRVTYNTLTYINNIVVVIIMVRCATNLCRDINLSKCN